MNKKLLIIFIAVVVVMIIGVLIVKFSHTPSIISNQKITGTITSSSASMSSINQASCLSDNEYADYPLDPEYATSTLSPKLPVTISVRDKNTHQIKFTFQIDNAYAQLSHPLELLKCGVYIIRLFNFDMKTFQQLPGFRVALWKYDYMGHGSELIPLDGTDSSGAQLVSYAYDFNIDPQEKYLVLDDQEPIIYGLVVKDLKSMDNILTTKLADLNRQYPSVTGDFDLGSWTPDGKHLVGSVYDGALDTAYYRIEVGTWKVQIFPSPPELRSGVERVMNYEGGYLAYVDIPSFTGIEEVTNQIIQQAIQEGKNKNLFIYDFITKQTIDAATTTPDKRFDMRWISSTTLQYILPSGTTSAYVIK